MIKSEEEMRRIVLTALVIAGVLAGYIYLVNLAYIWAIKYIIGVSVGL